MDGSLAARGVHMFSFSGSPYSSRVGGRGGSGQGRRGRMGGSAAGPGGYCVCSNCGYKVAHTLGKPCYQQLCPKCGTRMTRLT